MPSCESLLQSFPLKGKFFWPLLNDLEGKGSKLGNTSRGLLYHINMGVKVLTLNCQRNQNKNFLIYQVSNLEAARQSPLLDRGAGWWLTILLAAENWTPACAHWSPDPKLMGLRWLLPTVEGRPSMFVSRSHCDVVGCWRVKQPPPPLPLCPVQRFLGLPSFSRTPSAPTPEKKCGQSFIFYYLETTSSCQPCAPMLLVIQVQKDGRLTGKDYIGAT